MGAFYSKYRKIFLAFFITNILISMLQLTFVYSHYLKHEWIELVLSVFFASVNALCAVHQYQQWRRVQREEKEYMWSTLSAEVVR
jgi:putative effector of murein hydrolase